MIMRECHKIMNQSLFCDTPCFRLKIKLGPKMILLFFYRIGTVDKFNLTVHIIRNTGERFIIL